MRPRRGRNSSCSALSLWALLTLAGSPVLAEAQEDVPQPTLTTTQKREATARYRQGLAFLRIGAREKAISEFRAAYDISRAPEFLFNIATTERGLGHKVEALADYQRCVREAPRGPLADKAADAVALLTTELEAEDQARRPRLEEHTPPATVEQPPVPSTSPPHPTVTPATPVAAPAVPAPAVQFVAAGARPRRPMWKRPVFWGVLAGVVTVSVAVGLGVGLGVHPRDPIASMGNWTLK
jgi:hypothetical protein